MNELYQHAHTFRLWLEATAGAQAPFVLLAAIAFLAVRGLRKYTPELWLWFESFGPDNRTLARVFQALPALIISTGFGALASGGDPWFALKAAVVSAFTPFVHHIAKAYRGDVANPKPPAPRDSLRAGALLAGLALLGCAAPKPEPVAPNPAQAQCLALELARKQLEEKACGADVQGVCASEAIMARSVKRRLECLEKH
jgi:hypothetical protein